MPRSSITNRRPILRHINELIKAEHAESLDILDLGIGFGEFGRLIRRKIRIPVRLTGVEVWERYRNPRWKHYDEIIVDDVVAFTRSNQRRYDVILLIDVLEHLAERDGKELLGNVIQQARRSVIVSTPVTEYPQGTYKGNPYEQHHHFWTDPQLRAMGFTGISYRWVPTYRLRPLLARLGVYALDKSAGKDPFQSRARKEAVVQCRGFVTQ